MEIKLVTQSLKYVAMMFIIVVDHIDDHRYRKYHHIILTRNDLNPIVV